ncbi:MAG: SWIM zinc finger family protein [Anaerolineae bacterium]
MTTSNGPVLGWWASRWQAAVARTLDATSMSEGRALVQLGLVTGLSVEVGLLRGQVGSADGPACRVRVSLRTLSDSEWDRCLDALASQAAYAAQLLNAELPRGVEGVMRTLGVPLFPEGRGDMEAECSCGHLRSCRHIAAVLLAAGERLSEDPFLLFELRGRTREDLVDGLRDRRLAAAQRRQAIAKGAATDAASASREELAEAMDAFWQMGDEVRDLPLKVEQPEVAMESIKMLGDMGFAEGEDLISRLEPVYRAVSERALEVAYDDHQDAED